MPIIDRRIEQLDSTLIEMKRAPSLADFLRLQYRRYQLAAQIRVEQLELERLSQGWAFSLPRVR